MLILLIFTSKVFSQSLALGWGKQRVQLDQLQPHFRNAEKIKIAVIDSGASLDHPALKANLWKNKKELNGRKGVDDDGNGYVDDIYGYNIIKPKKKPEDDNGHGSHCIGTIAATANDHNIEGILTKVQIIPIKAMNEHGSANSKDLIKAIEYAISVHADIISASWGGIPKMYKTDLYNVLAKAQKEGIIFVAAAGNKNQNNDHFPYLPATIDLENIISVGASNFYDGKLGISSYGARSVDVFAPGKDIWSTYKDETYQADTGSSMAVPFVSAAIAMIYAHKGKLPFQQIKQLFYQSGLQINELNGKVVDSALLNLPNLMEDIKAARNLPNPKNWICQKLPKAFKTSHPYGKKDYLERTISQPGAKFLKFKINRLETERLKDKLEFLDVKDNVIHSYHGKYLKSFESDVILGDQTTIRFTSDHSMQLWGVEISEYCFQ